MAATGTVILLVLFGFLIIIGMPISFAIAFSSLVIFIFDPRMSSWLLTQRTFAGVNSFILLAIPLFLLTGLIMNRSGITKTLIDLSNVLVGWIRGGLAHINVMVSMFFAGISGSSQADTAGIGSVLIPAMVERGYSREFTVAVTAASSTMGNIIPPSIMAVIYGAACNVSVGALFIGGVIPGILIGLSQMGLSYVYAIRKNYPVEPLPPFKKILKILRGGILPLITPVIIIGGIISGVFTPTEASVIAVVYSLFLAVFIYRTITLHDLVELFVETAEITSLVVFTIGTASAFGYIIGFYQISKLVSEFFSMITSPIPFLFLLIVLLMIVGCFMDAAPAIIILMPIIAPWAAKVGIHPIHLGVVSVMTFALGLVTPPYGLSLLLASQIGKISMERAFPVTAIFALVMLSIIILCALLPDLVLYLPRTFIPNMV